MKLAQAFVFFTVSKTGSECLQIQDLYTYEPDAFDS